MNLIVDIRIEQNITVLNGLDNDTLNDLLNHDEYLFNVYQLDIRIESGEGNRLKPIYNNLPAELEDKLLIPQVNTHLYSDENPQNILIGYTIPFRLDHDLSTGSKIF